MNAGKRLNFFPSLIISVQKISPDTKPKVQLQIVLHDGGANTFHFNNPAGKLYSFLCTIIIALTLMLLFLKAFDNLEQISIPYEHDIFSKILLQVHELVPISLTLCLEKIL